MRRNTFTKGLVTGTIVGAAVSMMFNPLEGKDRKVMRKKANRFMRTVSNVVEDIMDLRR